MATINQAVPTRSVQTGGGRYEYYQKSTTVSVTAHTVPVTATEEGSKSGVIDGIKEGTSETFTGFIKHDEAQIGPNSETTYPGYATIYPGGPIFDYTIDTPSGVSVTAGGLDDTYITFGKADWGYSGSSPYSINITYGLGTYAGEDSGTWEHTLSVISTSNEWCSSGELVVSVNSNGYTAHVNNSIYKNPQYSFDYRGNYTTEGNIYYGTGVINDSGGIRQVTTNFGSVSYNQTIYGEILVNVTANSCGVATVTADLQRYIPPSYTTYADVRFTGYYANGTKANNILVDYVNFDGVNYPKN